MASHSGHGWEAHGEAWAQEDAVGPVRRDLVLIGAGHAHLKVLRRLARQPLPCARLTLIARERYTTYSGMLPGVIAGLYRAGAARVGARRRAPPTRLVRTGQRTDPQRAGAPP